MLIFLALLHSLFFSPQQIRIPGPGGQLPASGSPFTFIQANEADNSASAATTTVTSTQTTGATHCLILMASVQDTTCANAASNNTWAVTDTGGDTFLNAIPNGTGYVLTTAMTSAITGQNYVAVPTVAVSGCSSAGAYVAQTTGTNPNINVTGIAQSGTSIASGCGPTLPTIAITGTHSGIAATAAVTVLGVQAGTIVCSALHYAMNVAGTTNNQVTFTHPNLQYGSVTLQEWSGIATSAALDAEADGESSSATSATTGSYSTVQNAEVQFMGSALSGINRTWTNTSGWTIPSGATSPSTGSHVPVTSQYQVLSSTVSGVTTTGPVVSGAAGAITGVLATFK